MKTLLRSVCILTICTFTSHVSAETSYNQDDPLYKYLVKDPNAHLPETISAPEVWIDQQGWNDKLTIEEKNAVAQKAVSEIMKLLLLTQGMDDLAILDTFSRPVDGHFDNVEIYAAVLRDLDTMREKLKTDPAPLTIDQTLFVVDKDETYYKFRLNNIDDDGELVDFAEYVEAASADEANRITSPLDKEQLLNLLIASSRVDEIKTRYNMIERQDDIVREEARLRAWENYLFNGYSQMPWELLINNGLGNLLSGNTGRPIDAPKWQGVFIHPELAAGVPVKSVPQAESTPHWALDIHALGLVHYVTDSRKWFIGASGTVSYNNDFGEGGGITVLCGGISRSIPNISLGYRWYDNNVQTVSLGVDFFNYLGGREGIESMREKIGF